MNITYLQSFAAAKDCKYVMFMPDDAVYNKWLFEVVKKSYKEFSDKIKCITYWQDNRKQGVECEHNKYWEIVDSMDGFMVLFEQQYFKQFKIAGRDTGRHKSVWWKLRRSIQAQGHKILRLKETLAEHIGNKDSAMHPGHRPNAQIYAEKLTLWKKPRILGE